MGFEEGLSSTMQRCCVCLRKSIQGLLLDAMIELIHHLNRSRHLGHEKEIKSVQSSRDLGGEILVSEMNKRSGD
jgi:hypothetical protein